MNNITIGIVARDEQVNNTKIKAITKNNLKYLDNLCNYIGLISYDNNNFNEDVLKLCDGIIIQGGSEIYPYHFKIVKYCLKNNIPLLGICMGHQIIGLYSTNKNEEDLVKVDNHYSLNDTHLIDIKENSLMHKLFGKNMYVNSRHLYKLEEVKYPFKITATSTDNVIEAIEYINDKHFILGVQFHPEDMQNMQSLYNYFIKEVIKRKKQ